MTCGVKVHSQYFDVFVLDYSREDIGVDLSKDISTVNGPTWDMRLDGSYRFTERLIGQEKDLAAV